MDSPLLHLRDRIRARRPLHGPDVLALSPWIDAHLDAWGRITPGLQHQLLQFERTAAASLPRNAAAAFQSLLARIGGRTRSPITLPEADLPFWLHGHHPFANYQSSPHLPAQADVVIIGCGLTGSSAAWHLVQAPTPRRIVALDQGDPCTQASGRNGGNFELIPENFLGEYQGLPNERAKWIRRNHRRLPEPAVRTQAERQARLILQFGLRNASRFLDLVHAEGIACDVSETGWFRIADTPAEEKALLDEITFAAASGVHFEAWSPERIRRELTIPARHGGRLAPRNGNYHPFKFVCGVLERALQRRLLLFTRTPVTSLKTSRSGRVRVETSRGPIETHRVIVATNAFTSRLLPELSAIQYYQSQILTLEHVPNTIRGMTVTEKKGDLYYNFPKSRQYRDHLGTPRGMLLVGGGLDRPATDPFHPRRSSAILSLVKRQTDERFPDTKGQPPSRVWTGPMAFTPDRLPVIGFLHCPGWPQDAIIVAAGFNGYGGTYCVETGALAAHLARTGQTPEAIPPDTFSPQRFLTP